MPKDAIIDDRDAKTWAAETEQIWREKYKLSDAHIEEVKGKLKKLGLTPKPNADPLSLEPLEDTVEIGTHFTFPLSASGGYPPYVFAADKLPSHVHCDPDGTLHGAIHEGDTVNVDVTVLDNIGQTAKATMTIHSDVAKPDGQPLVVNLE
jgi:hypothetical protein